MNTPIKSAESLREAIRQLEDQQLKHKQQLGDNYKRKLNSYKPVNVLKSSVRNTSIKKTAVIAGASLGAVFLFRKFLLRKAMVIPFTVLGFIGKAAVGSALARLKK